MSRQLKSGRRFANPRRPALARPSFAPRSVWLARSAPDHRWSLRYASTCDGVYLGGVSE